MTVAVLPHDQAVLDALATLGKPVGFAEAPAGALDGVRLRTGPDYVIVYPISGLRDGTVAADDELALVYQMTVVGRAPQGVRWLVDRIEPVLRTVAIAGRSVLRVECVGLGDVRPDNDIDPPVFFATPQWSLRTTPA